MLAWSGSHICTGYRRKSVSRTAITWYNVRSLQWITVTLSDCNLSFSLNELFVRVFNCIVTDTYGLYILKGFIFSSNTLFHPKDTHGYIPFVSFQYTIVHGIISYSRLLKIAQSNEFSEVQRWLIQTLKWGLLEKSCDIVPGCLVGNVSVSSSRVHIQYATKLPSQTN